MRQSMVHAFSEHVLTMDKLFHNAIAEACKPEAVQEIVTDAAKRYLQQALDEEVKNFLTYGEGRKLVRDEVIKRLNNDL